MGRRALAVAACVLLVACGSGGNGDRGGAATIAVKTFQFMPDHVAIRAGDSVRWTNNDDILHTVTARSSAWPTGEFKFNLVLDGRGSTQTFMFTAAGTSPYFCSIHQSMRGEVIVS